MKTPATITEQNGQLHVAGELNFVTVVALWQQSLPLLEKSSSQVKINLSKITSSNSAGLGLLVEWLKYGKRCNKQISLSDIPPQLRSIAKVAGVEPLLPDLG